MTGNNVLDLLDYKLKYFLQNNLGWSDLTEIQKQAIPIILKDENSLIIAPTASGKTESVLIPIYNKMITEQIPATSILYIAPLKALINDMDKRLHQWNKHFGYSATKWHGDVSAHIKNKYIKHPTDILLITPESLEVILINKNEFQKQQIFGNIKYVIIDEIHYFVESERGIQLNSLLKRISQYAKEFTKIGLSATVGNPDVVAEWIDYKNPATIIKTHEKPNIQYKIQYFTKELEIPENLKKYKKNKLLLFCSSRGSVEKYNKMLMDTLKDNVYIHHSSINKQIREKNEDIFKNDDYGMMINTTTLELGIDIGNIDLVSTLTPPNTMSSFLQKIGRSGRKSKIERALLFTSDNESSLIYLAEMNLSYKNKVENIHIRKNALDIYLHQILSIIFQKMEVKIPEPYYLLHDTYVFKEISKDTYKVLIKHLVDSKILDLIDGRLSLGYEFEKQFGNVNFIDFYSVFLASISYKIIYGTHEIGELDILYAYGLKIEDKFILAGQYWIIKEIDYSAMKIYVKKTKKTKEIPRWNSGDIDYTYLICREVYNILLNEFDQSLLSKFNNEFQIWLEQLIDYTNDFNLNKLTVPISFRYQGDVQLIEITTFAGRKVNYLLSNLLLEHFNIRDIQEDNYLIKIQSDEDIVEEIVEYYNNLKDVNNDEVELYINSLSLDNYQTKFSHYLPEEQQETTIKELIFNFEDFNDLISNTKMEIISHLNYDEMLKYADEEEVNPEDDNSEHNNEKVQQNNQDKNDTVIEMDYLNDEKIHLNNEDSDIQRQDSNDSLENHLNSLQNDYPDDSNNNSETSDKDILYNTVHYDVNLVINDGIREEDVITNIIYRIFSSYDEESFIPYDKKTQEHFNHMENEIIPIDNNKILINSADEEQLSQLPGFHLIHAKKIIKLREEKVYLKSFNDLSNLIGIDSEYIDELRDLIVFDEVEKFNKKPDEKNDNLNSGRKLDI